MHKGKRKAIRRLKQVSQSFGNGILGLRDRLPFGMYANSTVSSVLIQHPDYLAWWEATIKHPRLARSIAATLPAYVPDRVNDYDIELEMYGMDAFEW